MANKQESLIVAVDPMSKTLAVLERNRALEDAQFIRTLVDARTLGQVRAGSQRALRSVRDLYDTVQAENDADGHFDALSDDTPFSVIDWFDDDDWYLVMPLARLITEGTVPSDVLMAFGQEDRDIGLDYEQATWLRPEDSDAIAAELRARGYEVDDGPQARAILQDFDYTGAR